MTKMAARPAAFIKLVMSCSGHLRRPDVVSARRHSTGELSGHRATCCLEPIPLVLVGQGWNGDDLSLVEAGKRRIDQVLGRHHGPGAQIVDRQPGDIPKLRPLRSRQPPPPPPALLAT